MTTGRSSGKKTFRLVAGILLVIGLGVGGVSVYLAQDARAFSSKATRTEGKVLRNVWHTSRDREGRTSRSASAVVQFFAEGTPHEFQSSVSSNPPSFSAGDTVAVLYLPGAPDKARIDTFWQLSLGAFITGILGFVFTGAGLLLLWFAPRFSKL